MKPQPQPVKLLTVTRDPPSRIITIVCTEPGVTAWAFVEARCFGEARVSPYMTGVILWVNDGYDLDKVVAYLESYNEDVRA